jgi:hypothetical protein
MKSEEITPDTTDARSAKEDIKAFLANFVQLSKDFGRNFRTLPSFGGGGVVPGPKGKPQIIEAHGGELILPNGERLTVDITGKGQQVVNKYIDARHTFAEVPPEPHGWSKSVVYELEAA